MVMSLINHIPFWSILLVHLAQRLLKASGVALLGHSEGVEPVSDLLEPLIPSGLGHARVHLSVLVGLADKGAVEVLDSVTDGLVGARIADLLEEFEVPVRVPCLSLCGGAEHSSDIVVALDVSPLGKKEVPAVCHALARKSILEILERGGALELGGRAHLPGKDGAGGADRGGRELLQSGGDTAETRAEHPDEGDLVDPAVR
mmetsp:Transcript_7410/g.17924  ORF Transcript_7410/g.17924 Transcript_7410/m.17924 type:complete len:202 (-) Transcript_7410:24-629(-)